MRRVLFAALGCASLAACPRAKEAGPGVPLRVSDAGSFAARPEHVPNSPAPPLQLDASKLDRFLRYRGAMVGAYAQLSRAVASLGSKLDGGIFDVSDGGLGPLSELRDALERYDAARTRALLQADISATDADLIEQMVDDVLAARSMAKTLGEGETLERIAALARESRETELLDVLKQAKERKEAARALVEERKRYGGANVDLLLSREEGLEASQLEMMQAFQLPAR